MEGQIKRDGNGRFMKGNSYTHSEKTKQKMSNSAMGKIISVEQRIQISNTLIEKYRSGKLCPPRLGKNNSTETKEKMSKTRKKLFEQGKLKVWSKDKHLSEETKRKIRLRTQKPEFREMMRLHALEQFKNGMPEETRRKVSLNHRRYQSEEAKIKIGDAFRGEKHPNWMGGKSYEPYGLDFNRKFKRIIRERDNYCCVICNIHEEELGKDLSIHHIDYDKINTFPQNCISLCIGCHTKTNMNRQHWKTFFQSLLKERYNYEYTDDQKIILEFT